VAAAGSDTGAALFFLFMSRTTTAQNNPHPANVKQFHTLPHNYFFFACFAFPFSNQQELSRAVNNGKGMENLHNCLAL
jgi:hypothetical protein